MKAIDLISAGEKALVIYTKGDDLTIRENGDGQTGNWVVRRDVGVDSVILYRPTACGVEVHKGAFAGIIAEVEKRRRVIGFTGMQQLDDTDLKWPQFAGGGSNPIRYVSKP
jgi:hypothetical protein